MTMTNKYLEKIALHAASKGAIIGAAGLSAINYAYKKDPETGKLYTKSERVKNALGGVVMGALGGAYLGASFSRPSINRDYQRYSSYSHYRSGPSHGDLASHFKDMGVPSSLKTKAEITKFYKTQAMKNHPDRPGGNAEKMTKINEAWNKAKAHHDFEKMASLQNRYTQCLINNL